jgi:hypothetical protein
LNTLDPAPPCTIAGAPPVSTPFFLPWHASVCASQLGHCRPGATHSPPCGTPLNRSPPPPHAAVTAFKSCQLPPPLPFSPPHVFFSAEELVQCPAPPLVLLSRPSTGEPPPPPGLESPPPQIPPGELYTPATPDLDPTVTHLLLHPWVLQVPSLTTVDHRRTVGREGQGV